MYKLCSSITIFNQCIRLFIIIVESADVWPIVIEHKVYILLDLSKQSVLFNCFFYS